MEGRPDDLHAERIISMTELQKLSLKKLREMRLDLRPLVVRDNKRKQGMFVILDHEAYRHLVEARHETAPDTTRLSDLDFAHHGLFWDRPTMTNDEFVELLADPGHLQHRWAWTRLLERLPTRLVTNAVALEDLQRAIGFVRLRPPLQNAWESAIEYWTEKPRRRLT